MYRYNCTQTFLQLLSSAAWPWHSGRGGSAPLPASPTPCGHVEGGADAVGSARGASRRRWPRDQWWRHHTDQSAARIQPQERHVLRATFTLVTRPEGDSPASPRSHAQKGLSFKTPEVVALVDAVMDGKVHKDYVTVGGQQCMPRPQFERAFAKAALEPLVPLRHRHDHDGDGGVLLR